MVPALSREKLYKRHQELWDGIANYLRGVAASHFRIHVLALKSKIVKRFWPVCTDQPRGSYCWACEVINEMGNGCDDCLLDFKSDSRHCLGGLYNEFTDACHYGDKRCARMLAERIRDLPMRSVR